MNFMSLVLLHVQPLRAVTAVICASYDADPLCILIKRICSDATATVMQNKASACCACSLAATCTEMHILFVAMIAVCARLLLLFARDAIDRQRSDTPTTVTARTNRTAKVAIEQMTRY
jgi:hypothetical protein